MPNGLLTSPEVASRLGVSPRTVHRLVAAGQLEPTQKLTGPNGAFLFDPETVAAYIARRSEDAA